MNNLNFIKKIYRPYGYKINARNADLIWADKNENYDSIQSRYSESGQEGEKFPISDSELGVNLQFGGQGDFSSKRGVL